MTSLVCSDPPKMVCSDPPNMVCSDPFYILEGSLQTKDVIDGPRCMWYRNDGAAKACKCDKGQRHDISGSGETKGRQA